MTTYKPGDMFEVTNPAAPHAGRILVVTDVDQDGPETIICSTDLDTGTIRAAHCEWEMRPIGDDQPTEPIEQVTT